MSRCEKHTEGKEKQGKESQDGLQKHDLILRQSSLSPGEKGYWESYLREYNSEQLGLRLIKEIRKDKKMDVGIVKGLIENIETNLNVIEPKTKTAPLRSATAFKNKIAVGMLLDNGRVKIDDQDPRGYDALMIASWLGSEDIIDMELSAGANPFLKNAREETAMDQTTKESAIKVFEKHGIVKEGGQWKGKETDN